MSHCFKLEFVGVGINFFVIERQCGLRCTDQSDSEKHRTCFEQAGVGCTVKDRKEEDLATRTWCSRLDVFRALGVFLRMLRTHAFSHVQVS